MNKSKSIIICFFLATLAGVATGWWYLSSSADEKLIERLISKNTQDMVKAAQAVNEMPEKERDEIHEILLDLMLRDPDPKVRLRSSFALLKIPHTGNQQAFRLALTDPNEHVRASAATAMGTMKWREASEWLVPRLQDPSPTVRRSVLYSLGELGDTSVLPEIEKRKSKAESNRYVRESAEKAIRTISAN